MNGGDPCLVDIAASCGGEEITLAFDSKLSVFCNNCNWGNDIAQAQFGVDLQQGFDFDPNTARVSANGQYGITYGAAERLFASLEFVQEELQTTRKSVDFPIQSIHQ